MRLNDNSELISNVFIRHQSITLQVDKEELEEARWFPRQEAIQMLTHQHPKGLFCPPQQAIAHQLILAWVNISSNL